MRQIREEKGLSQETLAEEAGLHRTYIGGIERGERNLGLINLLQIAQALDVPPARLLQRYGPPQLVRRAKHPD